MMISPFSGAGAWGMAAAGLDFRSLLEWEMVLVHGDQPTTQL
jgi:hypothetical protein